MAAFAVLLAGGKGSRLRDSLDSVLPKQFLPLLSKSDSMLQLTARRALKLTAPECIFTITHQDYAGIAANQLETIHPTLTENLLLEPVRCNTAAAALSIACYLLEHYRNPTLVLLPCDHAISNLFAFQNCLQSAVNYAQRGDYILTLGVPPVEPDEDFGYLLTHATPTPPYPVKQFLEKPDRETASVWISTRHCYWNSGIFCSRAERLLQEAARYCPDLLNGCIEAVMAGQYGSSGLLLDTESYTNLPALPLDKAIMEHSQCLQLLPLGCGWQDVGTMERLKQAAVTT